ETARVARRGGTRYPARRATERLTPAGGRDMRGRRILLWSTAIAAVFAILAAVYWTPLQTRYLAYRLSNTTETDAPSWNRRGEQRVAAMSERLQEMAAGDPDLTVRPIARFHFQQLQRDRVQPAGGVVPR